MSSLWPGWWSCCTAPPPAVRLRYAVGGGPAADLAVFDLDRRFTVDPEQFLTMGRATPFAGMELFGVCTLTMVNGNIVWQEERI